MACDIQPLRLALSQPATLFQGLTQTFLSRESGGPTIFLVVLRIKSRHTNSYAYIIKK